jgi:hypothetical protein
MSKIREKDSGRFAQQAAMAAHPNIDKLDLAKNPGKPVTQNFQRGNLGPTTGHARANMPVTDKGPAAAGAIVQGPTVEPQ